MGRTRRGSLATAIADTLSIVLSVIGLAFVVRGGLDYPAFRTADWFATGTIALGVILLLACVWNGWALLSRELSTEGLGMPPAPGWIGAGMCLILAVAYGVVAARIPANGLDLVTEVCTGKVQCYVNYGDSRLELTVATIAFLVACGLFSGVAVRASLLLFQSAAAQRLSTESQRVAAAKSATPSSGDSD